MEDVTPFRYACGEFAKQLYGTDDAKHPGVAHVLDLEDVLLGGQVTVLGDVPTSFARYRLTPQETRVLFDAKGWRTVVDGIFINPVIGRKKRGDFRDEVILGTYDALVHHYYPPERVVLATLHTEMRYAGPREAIFHAIVRKNFGCTHFIVGRDHAGVGHY
jgi:sulfate adenylyltransferase